MFDSILDKRCLRVLNYRHISNSNGEESSLNNKNEKDIFHGLKALLNCIVTVCKNYVHIVFSNNKVFLIIYGLILA